MNRYLILSLFALFVSCSSAVKQKSINPNNKITVLSYNVENLFDTIDAPHKFDEDFTPKSDKNWNTSKYYKKLENIAKVISSVNKNELPEIIGIVEAENKSVLTDLANTKELKNANYKVILEEGPDARGIDCGLMYNPNEFAYIIHKAIPVIIDTNKHIKTRDILYVKGKIQKETVHIFVNHWSSRRKGAKETEPKRIASASTLKKSINNILEQEPEAKIIIMGDFNDFPDNKSISTILNAGSYKSDKQLFNTMYEYKKTNQGSHYYRGNFNVLDHIIVTRSLTNQEKGLTLYNQNAFIHKPDFLCYTQKNGVKVPNKTYGKNKYYGGYSDHFAIYVTFIIK